MTTLKIQIPEDKLSEVLSYVEKIGGEVIAIEITELETEKDEILHNSFFGENIKRVIRAFKS